MEPVHHLNVKSDKLLVKVHAEDGDIETGIKKFGAMLGDCVEIGCGSVLNPGTVIGRNCNYLPVIQCRGCVMRIPSIRSRRDCKKVQE